MANPCHVPSPGLDVVCAILLGCRPGRLGDPTPSLMCLVATLDVITEIPKGPPKTVTHDGVVESSSHLVEQKQPKQNPK